MSDIRYRTYCIAIRRLLSTTEERQKILELGPTEHSEHLFSHLPNKLYIGADLNSRLASVITDARKLSFRDNSFDFVLCSHVLEHVREDRVAIQELYRVLRAGGSALLQVPLNPSLSRTVEYPQPKRAESQHVRMYAQDYVDRLRQAGFVVMPKKVWRNSTEMHYYGGRDELLFFASKELV